jgi:hypothetical protein
LIEGNEFAFGGEFAQDGATVTAPTEGDVYIGAIWVGYQGIHTGVE